MTEKDIKELKKLSPEERIKRLKELQEKDKKEIAEAQKMIGQSEEQIATENELRDVPIPQLRAVSIDELFSPEEKELFKAKRFVSEIPSEEEVKVQQQKPLEDVAHEEAPELTEEQRQAQIHYQIQAEQEAIRPAGDLYNEMRTIYNRVKESGELSPEQRERVHVIHYADIEKVEDMRKGGYAPNESQAVAKKLVATQRMGEWINRFYRGAA